MAGARRKCASQGQEGSVPSSTIQVLQAQWDTAGLKGWARKIYKTQVEEH